MKILKLIKKSICLFLLIVAFFLVGCKQESNSISKTIYVGEIISIDIEDECIFTSADEEIATVSDLGIVRGISCGTTKIIAVSNSNTYEIELIVNGDDSSSVLVTNCKQTLAIGEEVNINPSMTNATENYSFSFESNDTSVVTVSSTGVMTGVGAGICTVTITAISSQVITSELIIYVKNVTTDNEVVNNIIENKTYEVIGNIDLTSLNSTVTNIVSENKESVVGVSNYQYVQYYMQRQLEEVGIGTGFIFDKKEENNSTTYYVLTNHHVIEDNISLKIYLGYDDIYLDATLIASSSELDIAVVSFTSNEEFTLLKLGSVDDVTEGDFAIAIGNANGYEYFGSVTFGIISYCNRKLSGEKAVFLQHDVAINPGNSGGPLFDINGFVIGINTLKIVDDEVDNMGFAISINVVKEYLKTLGWNL